MNSISLFSSFRSTLPEIDWDNIGFGLQNTDQMFIAMSNYGGEFSQGEIRPFSNIEVSPSAAVLNYGQVAKNWRFLCVLLPNVK